MVKGTVATKRWNDPVEPGDGTRVFIAQYRPRYLRKADEPWVVWMRPLAPSKELHADFVGKHGPPINFETEYVPRYLAEMQQEEPRQLIADLARRVADGATITLLCYCKDVNRCHRTLLKQLIETEVKRLKGARRAGAHR